MKKALQMVGYFSLIFASIFSIVNNLSDKKVFHPWLLIALYSVTVITLVTYAVLEKKSK